MCILYIITQTNRETNYMTNESNRKYINSNTNWSIKNEGLAERYVIWHNENLYLFYISTSAYCTTIIYVIQHYDDHSEDDDEEEEEETITKWSKIIIIILIHYHLIGFYHHHIYCIYSTVQIISTGRIFGKTKLDAAWELMYRNEIHILLSVHHFFSFQIPGEEPVPMQVHNRLTS